MSELVGKFTPHPCPHCGRESWFEEVNQMGWESPCPSDDCPEHHELAGCSGCKVCAPLRGVA